MLKGPRGFPNVSYFLSVAVDEKNTLLFLSASDAGESVVARPSQR